MYEEFIERVLTNPLAVLVKRADLADNMDVWRLSEIGPKGSGAAQRPG